MRTFSFGACWSAGDILRSSSASCVGGMRRASGGAVRRMHALRAAFASLLKTFSKKCLTEIAVLLI